MLQGAGTEIRNEYTSVSVSLWGCGQLCRFVCAERMVVHTGELKQSYTYMIALIQTARGLGNT